jgi:hypothetical protein
VTAALLGVSLVAAIHVLQTSARIL